MRLETSIDIDADPGDVWAVLTDVERWSEWTESVTSAERLDEGSFAVGSRALLRQPKLPDAVWEVSDLEPGRSFVWRSATSGLRITAAHILTPRPEAGVRLTLRIDVAGFLAPVLGRLTARTTRRYLRMEAEGLRRRCESPGG